MTNKIQIMRPLLGVLFTALGLLYSCSDIDPENSANSIDLEKTISYLKPIDSITFDYTSSSWIQAGPDYSENRYGQVVYQKADNSFFYSSINSKHQLHHYNFETGEHSYSKMITNKKFNAYLIDSSLLYYIADGTFFIKDHSLNTIDSFQYIEPSIRLKHDIDFSVENTSNLFHVGEYFALLYFEVDSLNDGSNLYRNSEQIFYFFNRDTAFFTGIGCPDVDTTFQYFRYPAIASKGNALFHSARVSNCISKTTKSGTVLNSEIENHRLNYLPLHHTDQYQISKLRKYRFSTDYNRDLMIDGDHVILLKEIPTKIYYEDNVRTYEHALEIKKFDEQLKVISVSYIKNKIYSNAYVKNGNLYLFDFTNNKAYIYEI